MNTRQRNLWPSRAIPVLLAAGMLSLAGCASTPPRVDEIAAAEQAIRNAEGSNAGAHAPAELRRAREKLARARAAQEDHEAETAEMWAEQALVDAQLAEQIAEARKAEKLAQEIADGVNALRRELERGGRS